MFPLGWTQIGSITKLLASWYNAVKTTNVALYFPLLLEVVRFHPCVWSRLKRLKGHVIMGAFEWYVNTSPTHARANCKSWNLRVGRRSTGNMAKGGWPNPQYISDGPAMHLTHTNKNEIKSQLLHIKCPQGCTKRKWLIDKSYKKHHEQLKWTSVQSYN